MNKTQEALKMAIEVMTERGWYADKRCSDLIQICKEALAACEQAEPFGYFKAEPFGWTDCADTDEGAIALYEYPPDQTAEIERLKEELLSTLNDGYDMAKRDYVDQNIELQAYINELREALEQIKNGKWDRTLYYFTEQILAQTPAQSLQAHDDEIIERCAKVCEELFNGEFGIAGQFAEAIRALKGKQNG